MFKHLLIFILGMTTTFAEPQVKTPILPTAAELHKTATALAPDLIDATIAIFVGNAGSGSGVIVSPDGLCISAAHVTSTPGKNVKVLLSDGRELPALTLGVDHSTDGSLLKITAPGPFPYRPYIKEKTYEIGDWVLATGHPGGPIVGRPAPVRLGQIISDGVESGFSNPIATTAIVISGDSGGPLFNLKGEVIGINSNIGMPWQANQHVPLPSIIAKWDHLLDSKTFGGRDNVLQSDFPYDDPYEKLRERFLKELANHPDHPLVRYPRLLSPNEMQAQLDKWAPDEAAKQSPSLGLTLDLNNRETSIIASVEPHSPAAAAGLKTGDIIASLNGQAIFSPVSFALALAKLDPTREIMLGTSGARTLTLTPKKIPRRRHFPMPLAGMVGMIINENASGQVSEAVTEIRTKLIETAPKLPESVVEIRRGDKVLVHASVVADGELLTKASELGDLKKIQELTCHHKGSSYPVTLINHSPQHDVALLKTEVPNLTPLAFRVSEPRVGSLVFSPSEEGTILGCITQPIRESPKPGYEHNETAETPTGWLGISFAPDANTLMVASVDVGSPADTAGILEGDLIIKFGTVEIKSQQELLKAISSKAPGEKITLVAKRADEEITLKPILGVRPPPIKGIFQRQSAMRDDALKSLSARGGKLSKRRLGFPKVIYHDQIILPHQAGTPLFDVKGRAIGMNLAKTYRHRSLALPAGVIDELLWKLRR